MDWVKVGEVTNYFSRINVAAIALADNLQVGDWIGFVRHEELLFEQEVISMQIDRQDIASAIGGEEVGLRVEQKVKPDTEVFKLVG